MTIGDEFISAAIKYQTACSKYQLSGIYDFKQECITKELFNRLRALGAEIDDRIAMRDQRISELTDSLAGK